MPDLLSQRRLATLWFSCAGPLTAALAVTTLTGKLLDPAPVWQWYGPLVVPTLMLMLATFRAPAKASSAMGAFYYRLCRGLSLFYWLCLYLTVGAALWIQSAPFAATLAKGTLFLTIIQALVGYSLGAFFTAPQPKSTAPAADAAPAADETA